MKKKAKIILIILGGILNVAIMIVVTIFMTSGSNSRKYQKHMEAAQQYLDELQYEQAIAEYELAIEIEPKNPEAYQALAELYVQIEDYESAIMVLERGLEQIESRELGDYLEDVQVSLEEKKAQRLAQEQLDELLEGSQEPATENGLREETIYRDDGSYCINEYDGKGSRLKWTDYNTDGTINIVCEYDGNGNQLKQTWYNTDGTINIIFEYDRKGNLSKETWYNVDGTICSVYEYDGNEKLVKKTWYNADGTISEYSEYEYDEKGNLSKRTEYNADGTISLVYRYEYDGNGKLVKETGYDSDGTICDYSEYDANRKLIKFYDKGCFWRDEYDTEGNVIKEIIYRDYEETMMDGYWVYEYDKDGNCIKEIWNDSGGAHEYVYDEQ